MEEIFDNSKNKYNFKLSKQENDLIICFQSTSNNKKYELITTLEKLKESDEEFFVFKNIDRLLKVIKDNLDKNQYTLKLVQEQKYLELEIKNSIFEKGFVTIQIPEKENEIINLDLNALNILNNFSVHIGDIITTIRDLSKDDNWLECRGQEFDTKKYPKLAKLFEGEENIHSKWKKGAYLGSQTPPYYGGLNWSKLIKSNMYYGCIRKYFGRKDGENYYKYDFSFTNNKFSNNWHSIGIMSTTSDNFYVSGLSYINNTWIIPFYSCDSSSNKKERYISLAYCQGDKHTVFNHQNVGHSYYNYSLSGNNDIVYGNGFYVISAVKEENYCHHPSVIINKELNNRDWTFKETSKDNGEPSSFIFINNTFAFCFVGIEKTENNNNTNNKYISITYCKGTPTNNWTTVMIVPPDADEKSNPSLAYIAPWWMVFYTCNNTPYVSFSENLKGKWETKEAPFYDGNSSYVLGKTISQSENIVMVIGKKNDNYFTWYGSTPLGEWKEISCEVGLNNINEIGDISYSGDEWLSIINSGGDYYLIYKKDSAKPCLPLIENSDNTNLKSYIRAK